MKDRNNARNAKSKVSLCTALLLISLAPCAMGVPPGDWWLTLEPRFMKPAAAMPVRDSKRTVLAAGRAEGLGIELLTAEDFGSLGVGWRAYREQASRNASIFLASLEPQIRRDASGIVEYITLRSDRPFVAGAVNAPEFAAMFADTLGPDFLVVVPNRYLAYAFPKLAGDFREFAPMVIRAYKATPYPVSLEVFEVGAEGLKAVGVFDEP